MINQSFAQYGSARSIIRELFEFGRQRAAVVGAENVLDFTLGNPSTPPPKAVYEAIEYIMAHDDPMSVCGYTSSAGSDGARSAIAASLNRRFGTAYGKDNIFIIGGAAPALTACLKAVILDGESEVIAVAPFFPEYEAFVKAAGGTFKMVPADIPSFQINFEALEALISPKTQAVIINSPNNPSGVVYTAATLSRLSELLRRKSEEYGHAVYLIADEPYRELVYGDVEVPFVPCFYDNTLVCYSYSKSLSLPGQRIGYVLVPSSVDDFEGMWCAVAGSARIMGHVCASSLFQRVVELCVDVQPDMTDYAANRALLYEGLTAMGYTCAKPDGAFYMFVAAPDGDSAAFCERAKARDLIVVPGDSFGCPEYLRVCYCVPTERVKKALPVFKALRG